MRLSVFRCHLVVKDVSGMLLGDMYTCVVAGSCVREEELDERYIIIYVIIMNM